MTISFFIGLALTIAFISISVVTGLHKERGVYPSTLIAIAGFYIVFAFEHGTTSQIILNLIISGIFMAFALWGYLRGLYIIAFALIGHGLMDIIYPAIGNSPAPDWWGPFCLAIDLVLGGFLIFCLKTAQLKNYISNSL